MPPGLRFSLCQEEHIRPAPLKGLLRASDETQYASSSILRNITTTQQSAPLPQDPLGYPSSPSNPALMLGSEPSWPTTHGRFATEHGWRHKLL